MAGPSSSPGAPVSRGRRTFAALALPLAAFGLAFAAGRAGRDAPEQIGPASASVELLSVAAPAAAKTSALPALARDPKPKRKKKRATRPRVTSVGTSPPQVTPAPANPTPSPAPAPAPRPAPAPQPAPYNGPIDDSG